MPIEQLALLAVVAVLATSAMVVALSAAWYAGRRGVESAAPAQLSPREPRPAEGRSPDAPREALEEAALDLPRPGVYDRVVRVVAFLFLATVGVVTGVSNAYPDTDEAVYLLVAGGTLFIVFMQDLVPAGLLGRARYWVEAGFGVGFMAVLVGLTGGLRSPFFLGFFLLVAGASLSVEGTAPVLLALVAGAAYALVGGLEAGPNGIDALTFTWMVFNLVALGLLAYIASAAGNEQRRAREAALRLSRFDPLTGLYNRSYFFAVMDREVKRSARMGRGFALLMLDLDDLKPVNDTFGHHYGDRLLRGITDVLQRTVRVTDTAARYGGDEFVVLLPETDPEGAFVVADKLRRDVAALAIRVDQRMVRTSISVGLVNYPADGTSVESLMSASDAAMYEAKRRGKDQIVGYTTRTERVATAIGPERVATPIVRESDLPPRPQAMGRGGRLDATTVADGESGPPSIDRRGARPSASTATAPPPPAATLPRPSEPTPMPRPPRTAPPPATAQPPGTAAPPAPGLPPRSAAPPSGGEPAAQPRTTPPTDPSVRGAPRARDAAPEPRMPSLPPRSIRTPPPGAWQTRTRPGWPPETSRSSRAERPYISLPIETDDQA